MRHFTYKSFRGIERHRDATDLDRGALNISRGAFPVLSGGMVSAPAWQRAAAAPGTEPSLDADAVYEVSLTAFSGGRKVLLITDGTGAPREAHWVGGEVERPLPNSFEGVVFTKLGDLTISTGKNYYQASRVGRVWFLGNGEDPNKVYSPEDGTLSDLGTESADGPYDHGREPFPPCAFWAVALNGSVFGAGNRANPLRVWATEPPDSSHTFYEQIDSTVLSHTDILLNDATEIRALSAHNAYVVAHTDRGKTLLYSPDPTQADTGFRLRQAPSPSNAGAASQRVVSNNGNIYLGSDNRLYWDRSAVAGPPQKQRNRDEETADWKSSDALENYLRGSNEDAFGFYDPATGLYFLWAEAWAGFGLTGPKRRGLFIFDERINALAGPDWSTGCTAACLISDTSHVATFTQTPKGVSVSVSDFGWMRNSQVPPHLDVMDYSQRVPGSFTLFHGTEGDYTFSQALFDEGGLVQWSPHSADPTTHGSIAAQTTWAVGEVYLVLREPTDINLSDYGGFNGDNPDVWAASSTPGGGDYGDATLLLKLGAGGVNLGGDTRYFFNTYVSVIELPFEDFGAPDRWKDFYEAQFNFSPESVGFLYVEAETEEGRRTKRRGKLVDLSKRPSPKVFFNLQGRRLKLRAYVVSSWFWPWRLHDLSVGWTPGIER